MLSTWEDGLCGDLQGRRQPVMFNISLGKKWDKVEKLSNLSGGEEGSNLTQSYECQSNLCVAVASSLIILSMCKTFLTLLHCGRVDPFVSVDEPSVDVSATFSNILHPISLLT